MSANFSYHLNGQIAGVTYADGHRENYLWDGLALIHRDGTELLNEPAVTGGNPVLSGDKVLFNDLLGNTLGVKDRAWLCFPLSKLPTRTGQMADRRSSRLSRWLE